MTARDEIMTARDSTTLDGTTSPIDRVREHDLPERVAGVVDAYEEAVGDRDPFLWRWAHHLFPKFTLSSVPPEHAARVREGKLVGLMFVSVLDDVAEKHGDRATFEEAAKLPFDHLAVDRTRAGVDRDVLDFAGRLWERFQPFLRGAARSGEFREIVHFDVKQVVNAIDYSFVANHDVEFLNGSELRTYEAHNMMLFAFADVDLVHSPAFDRSDLSTLRRVIERAQRMVRIGNWITTWERELYESDFTSGIVVYALENDVVSIDDLLALKGETDDAAVEAVADRIRDHDVEDVFLRRWEGELAAARSYDGHVGSVDVGAYLDGIESVMQYHLASRGLK